LVDEIIALKGKIDRKGDASKRSKPSLKVSSAPDLDRLAKTAARAAAANPAKTAESPFPDYQPAPAHSSPAAEKPCPEIHIRLNRDAAEQEETLYPLRDYLAENPGPCSVYIHIPLPRGETVIRTVTQTGAPSSTGGALARCAGVAEVWEEEVRS
jgi:DNA polymerase-3 subunit alpha